MTDEASHDLGEIFEYVAIDSPAAAERLINQPDDAIRTLGDAALHYPLVHDRLETGVRRRVVGPYNLLFHLEGREIVVDRILHGARNATHILFPDD
ncbi:type II toxin-antitoxin system RelE/ParE family toxin [Devosia sp.]|uniref:type II toxin-antitoxin system RelE/ParE family toxin n=1 Tax=Devosia sp. TaxID=1871048 RepID=UPI001ACE9370|nr:type II toxin-antitoxin system RelE/ParE family toxin [Devosia sp.]MBN9310419.1 type II toxin-antitoxin system RelE/ParE family toxin [Devosia sp.]